MIRRALPEGDLCITQHEHALHAGRLAARFAGLPAPREALVRAVALHDAGWPLFDDAPEPLPAGRTPPVFDMETGTTTPAWRRSIAVARAAGPLEALLVSRHFGRFTRAFAAEQAPWEAVWRLGVPPDVEEAGAALVSFCDALSLRLLCDPSESVALPEGFRLDGTRLFPWPFTDDRIEDRVVGRLLPRRKWRSGKELRSALLAAPPHPLPLVLEA